MSAKKHHAHHSHLIGPEVTVLRTGIVFFVLYFLSNIVLSASKRGLLENYSFSSDFFGSLWQAISDVWLYRLGPIFIVLDVVLLGVLIFSVVKVWPLRQKLVVFGKAHSHAGAGHGQSPTPRKRNPLVLRHWTDIVRRANTGKPENLRWSILEADALVDLVLKEMQLPGEQMAERLTQLSPRSIKTLNKLWDAHRLRNEIAHTPGFNITTRQAEQALFSYRDFLKELRAF